jgi:hypothetical protein
MKMTKNEHCQLKLKSKATTGIEKFNIPLNTPVEYHVTLNNFEKVRTNQLKSIVVCEFVRVQQSIEMCRVLFCFDSTRRKKHGQ